MHERAKVVSSRPIVIDESWVDVVDILANLAAQYPPESDERAFRDICLTKDYDRSA